MRLATPGRGRYAGLGALLGLTLAWWRLGGRTAWSSPALPRCTAASRVCGFRASSASAWNRNGAGGPSRRSSTDDVAPRRCVAVAEDSKNEPKAILLLVLARNLVVWIVLYFALVEAGKLMEVLLVSEKLHKLETVLYVALAAIVTALMRSDLFHKEITSPLVLLSRTKSTTLKHFLVSAVKPLEWASKAVLGFFSVNFLAMAFPDKFALALPRHLRFLDPSRDGILTAFEIESAVAKISRNFLVAALATCLSVYILTVKRPPRGFTPPPEEKTSLIQAYWTRLLRHRGLVVILDLVFTSMLCGFAALQWFQCVGLDARTVLTFGGIGGIAVGLAAQSLVGNFISGILILVTQPFVEGDWIDTNGVQGIVRGIKWSYTEIETQQGSVVFLPNSNIVNSDTSNRTQGRTREVEVSVPFQFPVNGFQDCRELVSGLEERVAKGDLCEGRMIGKPEVVFKIEGEEEPRCTLTLGMILDNQGLGRTTSFESVLFMEVVDFLLSRGCTVPALHGEEEAEEPAAAAAPDAPGKEDAEASP